MTVVLTLVLNVSTVVFNMLGLFYLQSITMGELYGEVNKLTMEWRDGLMALKVRQCVQVKLSSR